MPHRKIDRGGDKTHPVGLFMQLHRLAGHGFLAESDHGFQYHFFKMSAAIGLFRIIKVPLA